jgi:hypothetical protein
MNNQNEWKIQPIFFPKAKRDQKSQINKFKKDKHKTPYSIIKILDFLTKNEIFMSRHIQEIPDFSDHFHIILKNSLVNISEVDKTLGLVKREGGRDPYVFLSYSFDSSQDFLPFSSYFGGVNCKRKMILNVVNSFKYLLKTVEILTYHKIVHFSFTPENIVFDLIDKPYLINFSSSFQSENMSEERKSNLFSEIDRHEIFLSLEANVCLFLNNHQGSLSKTNIEQLCCNFFGKLAETMEFIDNDDLASNLDKCKESVVFSLQSIINRSKEEAFKDLLTNCFINWDLYSLCMTYLFLVKSLTDRGLSCNFLEDFSLLLAKFVIILCSNREESRLHSFFLSKFEQMVAKCDFDDLIH